MTRSNQSRISKSLQKLFKNIQFLTIILSHLLQFIILYNFILFYSYYFYLTLKDRFAIQIILTYI